MIIANGDDTNSNLRRETLVFETPIFIDADLQWVREEETGRFYLALVLSNQTTTPIRPLEFSINKGEAVLYNKPFHLFEGVTWYFDMELYRLQIGEEIQVYIENQAPFILIVPQLLSIDV